MDHSAIYRDIDEINALASLSPAGQKADEHVVLGLYLYFADECSRLGRNTSFLTALREAGAGLKPDEKCDRDALFAKFMKACDVVELDEAHRKVLKEWKEHGTYTIEGDVNKAGEEDLPFGAYARLARDICLQQNYINTNLAISYALGNRRYIEGKSGAEVYKETKDLTTDHYRDYVDGHITQCIEEGSNLRVRRMLDLVHEKLPRKASAASLSEQMDRTRTARELLNCLPVAMLELLENEGFTISYARKPDISTTCPSELVSDQGRLSNKGICNFNVIFISDGQRGNPRDILDDERLHVMVPAQTLAHEGFHDVLCHLEMDKRDKEDLRQATVAVADEMTRRGDALPGYFHEKTKTIDTSTLAEVLDCRNDRLYGYMNKDGKDNRWVEVACNVFGLMHSEYPYPPATGKNNPYADLETLDILAGKLNAALDKALARSHKIYPKAEPGRTMAAFPAY